MINYSSTDNQDKNDVCQKNTKVDDRSEISLQQQPTRICSALQQLVDHTHHRPPLDGQLGSLDRQHRTAD